MGNPDFTSWFIVTSCCSWLKPILGSHEMSHSGLLSMRLCTAGQLCQWVPGNLLQGRLAHYHHCSLVPRPALLFCMSFQGSCLLPHRLCSWMCSGMTGPQLSSGFFLFFKMRWVGLMYPGRACGNAHIYTLTQLPWQPTHFYSDTIQCKAVSRSHNSVSDCAFIFLSLGYFR